MTAQCRKCGKEPGLTPKGVVVRHYAPGLNHIYVSAKRCKGSRRLPREGA